jgi:hypothetical protein
MRIALLLSTAFITTLAGDKNSLDRRRQYLSGIDDVCKRIKKYEDIDLFIADNTIADESNLCIDLKNQLSSVEGHRKFYKVDNYFGAKNKGCGLLAQWRLALPSIVEGYEYVIHYEPRQKMNDDVFLSTFLKFPENIFRLDTVKVYKYRLFPMLYRHFQTGYFSCNTRTLLDISLSLDENVMCRRSLSIERLIYQHFKHHKLSFKVVKQLGISWDSGNGYVNL